MSLKTRLLNERSDIEQLAAQIRINGFALVPDVLNSALAEELHRRAETWTQWNLVTRIGGSHRAFDAAAMDQLPEAKKRQFDEMVYAELGSTGFQYLYERFPIDEFAGRGWLSDGTLKTALEMVNDESFLDLLRRITEVDDITYCDLQLTRYRCGHFLTTHDDSAAGLHRRVAFVLGLTANWKPDYGGLLQFLDPQNHIDRAYTPSYNALAVFRVPRPHSVSMVPAFVKCSRLALMGWARAEAPVPVRKLPLGNHAALV